MELLQLIVNGIVTGTIYSLYATSFSVIFGTTRIFHFAHGIVFTCGAYGTFVFHTLLGLPLVFAILLSTVGTSLVGMMMNLVIYEPLRRRTTSGLVILVASMGTYIVLQAIISLLFTSNIQVLRTGAEQTYQVGAIRFTWLQVWIVCIVATINLSLALFFIKTEAGLHIRGLGENPELAEVIGISRRKVTFLIFAIGSGLAAVSCSLNALNNGTIGPHIGLDALLICFVALVVGGMENIPGAAAGGFMVGMISHLGIWKIESRWQMVVVFSVVIIVLLVKPKGLFAVKGKT